MELHLLDGVVEELKTVAIINNVWNLLFAVSILLLTVLISSRVRGIAVNIFEKLKLDKTIAIITSYLLHYGFIMSMLVLIMIYILNFSILTVITLAFVATVSLFLSFKKSMENLGSSYIIFFVKAFKVGDYIEVEDIEGNVIDMTVFNTTVKTINESVVIIPNSKLTSKKIINHSREGIRRIDFKFKLTYDKDVEKVKDIVSNVLENDNLVVANKDFIVSVDELKDDGIVYIVIAWVKTEDYWEMYYSLGDNIEKALRKNNIDMNVPIRYKC